MPKRSDIKSVLLLGAGPIVIGQGCEFDYSGTQACCALREEGVRVILVNSNPATIMTDPELADATYIEPLHWKMLEKIIAKEKPDALLPTMGGQTALNCALDLEREGVLEKYQVRLIGASREAIDRAEDREQFNILMQKIGLRTPASGLARDMSQAREIAGKLGFPVIIRPSFTLGGSGGGIAYNADEFTEICQRGFELSPTHECLIDESLLGWKEFELEVVRDRHDNCIVVCGIENIDPLGVHTGDSITVAPIQTLTDKEYQRMRDAAICILRAIGVETGGANVQFAVNPDNGDMVVIEMNPRVSRSSALASKATGFPIAQIAAKLAIGYTLDELTNAMTNHATPASFEPSIDYVVVKMPRFHFEKFAGANTTLTTQMKSVGEAMALGSNFQSALLKAMRSLEVGCTGLANARRLCETMDEAERVQALRTPTSVRLWLVLDALRRGMSVARLYQLTKIDTWFLDQLAELIVIEKFLQTQRPESLDTKQWRAIKLRGITDASMAAWWQCSQEQVREKREQHMVLPSYKRVDSCAAEFPTDTAYFYSSYHVVDESSPSEQQKILILGSGPNRIGQGIEFDYCCVHAALALRDAGYETIMLNCNPETVSTDHQTADRLYFEPLTFEDVYAVVQREQPTGVLVQLGGQTPLSLAASLAAVEVPILGTPPHALARAEDRQQFQHMIERLGLKQPALGIITDTQKGGAQAEKWSYPILVRPSHVLGGRAMEILHNADMLRDYLTRCPPISDRSPLLVDRFLDRAIEVDVDAVCDGKDVLIAGIMEHIEHAGVHSGDSSCVLPPQNLSQAMQQTLSEQVVRMANHLGVCGLMNTQFAIQGDDIYVLEVNPRASRTIPFVAKATGVPWIKIAVRCMIGQSLESQNISAPTQKVVAVKQPIFPFVKFPDVDPVLGPEMRSTGEAMGLGVDFGSAYAKGQLAVGKTLPRSGCAFLSVRAEDKAYLLPIARELIDLGFGLVATRGTAAVLQAAQLPCEVVNKVREGRPHVVDMIANGKIDFILNTPSTQRDYDDAHVIHCSQNVRRQAIVHEVWYTTTLAGAEAACQAMRVSTLNPAASLQTTEVID